MEGFFITVNGVFSLVDVDGHNVVRALGQPLIMLLATQRVAVATVGTAEVIRHCVDGTPLCGRGEE